MTVADAIIVIVAIAVVAAVLYAGWSLPQPVEHCRECGARFVVWDQTRSLNGRSFVFRVKGCPRVRDGEAEGDLIIGHYAEVIDTRYAK